MSGVPPGQLQRIALLILDVDGVLTDGGIYYGDQGEPLRRFHIHDGQGIKALRKQGVEVVIVTSHCSEAVSRRAEALGITSVFQGVADKLAEVTVIIQARNLQWTQVAYVGDDIVDLPVMDRVGLPVAVADAVPEVKQSAAYVTKKPGGHGAVREVCELIMGAFLGASEAIGVIPARYDSSRFPGKPLASINGKPMIYHVYERARASCLDDVVVATDDSRILEACQALGCHVRLTSSSHRSGTERVAEIARESSAGIWINIQGDEPLMAPGLIDDLISMFVEDPFVEMATARRLITEGQDVGNPNVVKVVVDDNGNALYFSRAAIPHDCIRGHHEARDAYPQYYRHVGIYGYRRAVLLQLAALTPTPLELAEGLEQLRALEHGTRIKVIDTDYSGIEVNTPEDLRRAERVLDGQKEES